MKSPKSSGQSSSVVKVTRKTSTPKVGFDAKTPEVIIKTPKGKKISTEQVNKKIMNNEKMIKVGKFLKKNKKPLMITAAATTATLGGIAYKKHKDNKNKK